MLNSLAADMRPIRPSLALLAAAAVMTGAPAARAQGGAGPAAQPAACVSATGPDSDTGSVESVMRAARSRHAAGDTAQRTALRLFAAVQADEVRFERQPTICVTLRGDARLDSVRIVGRRNLASPVVRGTTYRDIYVAVEILGHLDAECISARITGGAAARPGDACAALGVRDSTAGRRTGAPPP